MNIFEKIFGPICWNKQKNILNLDIDLNNIQNKNIYVNIKDNDGHMYFETNCITRLPFIGNNIHSLTIDINDHLDCDLSEVNKYTSLKLLIINYNSRYYKKLDELALELPNLEILTIKAPYLCEELPNNIFKNLHSLIELNLYLENYNKFNFQLPRELKKLKILSSKINVFDIENFLNFDSIEFGLKIYKKLNVQEIDLNGCEKLDTVVITHGYVEKIDLRNCPVYRLIAQSTYLKELKLKNHMLKKLPIIEGVNITDETILSSQSKTDETILSSQSKTDLNTDLNTKLNENELTKKDQLKKIIDLSDSINLDKKIENNIFDKKDFLDQLQTVKEISKSISENDIQQLNEILQSSDIRQLNEKVKQLENIIKKSNSDNTIIIDEKLIKDVTMG